MDELTEQLNIAGRQADPHTGKTLSQVVLEKARSEGNDHVHATALAYLADYNHSLGQQRQAFIEASRAAQMLHSQSDNSGEARALMVVSRAAQSMGLSESAIEASLLAVALTEGADDAGLESDALSQLGILLAYNKSFDEARRLLEKAERLARMADCALDELVAIARQFSCETVRIIHLRHETGIFPESTIVGELLTRSGLFRLKHDMEELSKPDQAPLLMFVELAEALFNIWSGRIDTAADKLVFTREWFTKTNQAPWMEGFLLIAEVELALSKKDWQVAEQAAGLMCALTGEANGHQQSVFLGHLLLAHCLEMQSNNSAALQVLKELSALERRWRTASLDTRHEITQLKLQMRRTDIERRKWMASASELQRLSMEDPLTGIANRRYFESEAHAALRDIDRGLPQPLCLALLDVDRFKQVNDCHSHVVGDKVLQTIGTLLRNNIRDTDIAARLGGDEFVVLFRKADEQTAREACLRVASAVKSFEWSALSPGLTVGVSIGLSTALPGDTLETRLPGVTRTCTPGKSHHPASHP